MSENLIVLIACTLAILFISKNYTKSCYRIALFSLQSSHEHRYWLMRAYRREQSCIGRIIFLTVLLIIFLVTNMDHYKAMLLAIALINYIFKFYFVRRERLIYLQYTHPNQR